MGEDALDVAAVLDWVDGLPKPRWDLVEGWVEKSHEPAAHGEAWTAASRAWLAALGPALGPDYMTVESDHFLMLAPGSEVGRPLLGFAERTRSTLAGMLPGVASFDGRGKEVVVALRTQALYYRYVSLYFPEGEHGESAGLHVREGLPHVVLYGRQPVFLESILVHEMTHAALHHLTMPQWLEEGLAQMIEQIVTGRVPLEVTQEMATRHKRYWGENGLDAFWTGEGFSKPGEVQGLSYQLAEVAVRLLADESRPRWFGWDRRPQERFLDFLADARAADCGEAACREHLGRGVGDLVARFLGPGEWSPPL